MIVDRGGGMDNEVGFWRGDSKFESTTRAEALSRAEGETKNESRCR